MKSTFQTILIVLFAVAFAGAILVFSGLISFGSKKSNNSEPQGQVQIWGVIPRSLIQPFISNFNISDQGYSLVYTEHSPETIEQDLIVALANNTPPDLIIFSSEIFTKFKDYLYTIPYATYSERLYRDLNVDGAQIFLNADGVIALPLVVDPLVVYYNKDILAKSSFVYPPKTWSTLQQTVSVLTKLDPKKSITQSTIALGTAQNIDYMKDILSTLFMQTGNPIIENSNGSLRLALGDSVPGTTDLPAAQALDFYVSFSNPTNANYSWNNSLPLSRDMFISGKSAFYIGRASDLFVIQSQNPNLNFDVTEMFQTDGSSRPVTFGSFLGVGIVKTAPNPIAAQAAAYYLVTKENSDALSKALSLPPVQRALLLERQDNPYISVFFNAALTSFSWPDPDHVKTEALFRDMINDVSSGRNNSINAIHDASRDLGTNFN